LERILQVSHLPWRERGSEGFLGADGKRRADDQGPESCDQAELGQPEPG
jgi:hypothetical protein